MKKLSQKNLAIALLKQNIGEFMPAWEFVGEKYLHDYGWVLMSYKTPARLSDIHNEGVEGYTVERQLVKDRSGATYYEYKLEEAK